MSAFDDALAQHQPLIRKVARQHARHGVDARELEGAGAEGFWEAYQRYDREHASGASLTTYAHKYIVGAIKALATELLHSWRVSKRDRATATQRSRARRRLQQEGTDRPTRQEIADEIGVDVEALERHDSKMKYTTSFDETRRGRTVDEDGDGAQQTLAETLGNEDTFEAREWTAEVENQERRVERAEALKQITALLRATEFSDKRVRGVLYCIYYYGQSEGAVGKSLGISQQAVSKIHKRALREMKVVAEANGWAPTGAKGYTPKDAAVRAFARRRIESMSFARDLRRARRAWFYETFGSELRPEDVIELVRAGYRALAKKFHPDINGGNGRRMAELTAAREWAIAYLTKPLVNVGGRSRYADAVIEMVRASGRATEPAGRWAIQTFTNPPLVSV